MKLSLKALLFFVSRCTQNGLCALIILYRNSFSLLLPSACRFYPSCSFYALESIKTHGAFKGSYLALRRILRCHPFHQGGFDPVPPIKNH